MLIVLLFACTAEKIPDAVASDETGAWQAEGLPIPQSYDAHPEPPTIIRDVALIDDDVQFSQPFVPGHRTTMDGRVALRVQGGPPGTRLAENLSFFLFVPERLHEPIMAGPAGAEILSVTEPWDVPFPPALEDEVVRLGHHAICDPTTEFPIAGERPNPYACGEQGDHDCYDLTIINSTSTGFSSQLWGTPVTVHVASPKTVDAAIAEVTLGEPVAGATIALSTEFTEPAVTIDGRLLTGRVGGFPRQWTNPETAEVLTRPYDLMYAQLPEDAAPCDVTGWTSFHPISHAPYDPQMQGKYGMAAYPFRDTEGQLIADGEDMGGTYPWVDREGANVFMTGVHGRISEQSEEQYPRRCAVAGCEAYEENIDWDRGFMVGGLWTHGKMVHVDGMINNIDWAVGVTPGSHWLVDLYRSAAGESVPVRVGSGRFIESVREEEGPYPAGYSHNANIMDSLQSLFNWQPKARPISHGDVVWVMSTGVATDELTFDPFLDPNAFIVSNMQASITQLYDEQGQSTRFPVHNNGQVRELDGPPSVLARYVLQPEQQADIHLQNAATSLRWRVPAYGLVKAGTGRVEPVALGGVKGRGFWLSGSNEIRYAVPEQPQSIHAHDWTMGIYVDARYASHEVHTLFSWPDGSQMRLLGSQELQYVRADKVLHTISLPESSGWMHLGWRMLQENQEIIFLWNGVAIDRWSSDDSIFAWSQGDFVVGQAGTEAWGFRGWIDDLVVLAHDVNPEVACNHAGGTLLRLEEEGHGLEISHIPSWAHAEIAAAAQQESGAYACFTDYDTDYAAHRGNLPAGTTMVREAITFPEGPVQVGQPRPDSSHNGFCLSCHSAEGKGGLGLDALSYQADLLAEDDPRRQPSQPPRRVFGNIPANWIAPGQGTGSPAEAFVAPAEGVVIDHWLLPTGE